MDREAGVRGLPARGREDPPAHPRKALPRGALRHPHPQGQAADHRGHLHGAPGNRHRQVRRRGRRAAPRAPRDHEEERPHQHQRDQAPRARRQARRAVDRGAAREPRQLPAGDEALARLGDALGRAGHQDRRGGPPRRRRDEPSRDVLRGARPAAHDPRGHRLRPGRGEDDRRPDRRQGLDQQGRDHARGLRGRHGGADSRLGDQDQARRRRGASSEGLGASREGRGRQQDREGLGIVPRRRRGQRPGGGRPGQRPRRDERAPQDTAAPATEAQARRGRGALPRSRRRRRQRRMSTPEASSRDASEAAPETEAGS